MGKYLDKVKKFDFDAKAELAKATAGSCYTDFGRMEHDWHDFISVLPNGHFLNVRYCCFCWHTVEQAGHWNNAADSVATIRARLGDVPS